ncbi:MAG: methylmalonyl-CoA mutase subunit beta [Robiginitalea sp.]|uniref:methylmalonyl-CoA mutase subunit beta n=1 Tax=Robiginitalea sp. TaxID=1902411 RepID=UPI003C7835DE
MKNAIDFSEFPRISDKAWKQQIQVDLKGGDYNELLTWTSPEGIVVKPFYSAEDLPVSDKKSADSPRREWRIGYALDARSSKSVSLLVNHLENGVETLWIKVHGENTENLPRLATLDAPQFWDACTLDEKFADVLKTAATSSVHILVDPIHSLAESGNWATDEKIDFEVAGNLARQEGVRASLAIHSNLYQNAGANRIQELAYALAHGCEYLEKADTDNRLKPLLEEPVFLVATGSDYFFEIAKIRALRRLWEILSQAYGFSGKCKIIASPTLRNKTLYDYNTNMLRTTTESMAGILGGADLICNLPYDALYHPENDFAARIARNQLLLLKHESYFSSVRNPADGSYYIESLTDQLGQKALELFKTIEKGGGFLSQLQAHTIQKKIAESAEKEQKAFDKGDRVLVGTNKYANTDDRMRDVIEKDPFRAIRKVQTRIAPVLARRLSESNERKRLEDEQS